MPVLLGNLADALYREEVLRARAMRPDDKLLEGPRLFERACRIMADGIRHRHPEFGEDDVRSRVADYVRRSRALEQP